MKLFQMPVRTGFPSAGVSGAASDVLPQVWATEGNLAQAVELMHAEEHVPSLVAGAAPMRRVVLAPETAFYRSYTEAMLRRYATLRMESGRVPSMLGREMFRGRVTSYRVHGFDDVVIFVHDVEGCLETLKAEHQRLILRIGVQEYTYTETEAMLGVSLRTVQRRYMDAVDALTAVFLQRGLLERIATDPCQAGGTSAKVVSHTPEVSYD